MVRSPQARNVEGFKNSSYLAQTCAFHSRVHKHADDLSLIWWEHGHQILIDPGKYGYLDPSPKNPSGGSSEGVLLLSPSAHLCEVDGRSQHRRNRRTELSPSIHQAVWFCVIALR